MALQEFDEQYYKIDYNKCFIDNNNVLHISFLVYKNAFEREKEKDVLKIYQQIKSILKKKIQQLEQVVDIQILEMQQNQSIEETNEIKELQNLTDLDTLLLETLYKKTNEHKEYILSIIEKYDEFLEIKSYIQNPIDIIYKGKIIQQNYEKQNPTLEDLYNLLKTRIGKNIDI